MRKYEVYLTTGETIEVEADTVVWCKETGDIEFLKGDKKYVNAMFTFTNICGWREVD